jgi:MOSC domain-containing protein YiiM
MILPPFRNRRPASPGRLSAIFTCPGAGAGMQSLTEVQALAGQGLAGDRYALGRGHWHPVEACQLTLITEQELAWAEGRAGRPLGLSFHRRNLVVAGLMPRQLREQRLQIGEALFVWQRPRPPCGYLDRVSGAGMARALGKGSGSCFKVLAGGLIRVGDPVLVLESK